MSRAFVKEGEDDGSAPPERAVSPHRNLVTASGLAAMEATLRRLDTALSAARAAADTAAVALCQRDLRYWTRRRANAELVPAASDRAVVRFGSTVVLAAADGRHRSLQIVGEDEADPAEGRLSYVAPLATELLGAGVGDEVGVGPTRATIVEIR